MTDNYVNSKLRNKTRQDNTMYIYPKLRRTSISVLKMALRLNLKCESEIEV